MLFVLVVPVLLNYIAHDPAARAILTSWMKWL